MSIVLPLLDIMPIHLPPPRFRPQFRPTLAAMIAEIFTNLAVRESIRFPAVTIAVLHTVPIHCVGDKRFFCTGWRSTEKETDDQMGEFKLRHATRPHSRHSPGVP